MLPELVVGEASEFEEECSGVRLFAESVSLPSPSVPSSSDELSLDELLVAVLVSESVSESAPCLPLRYDANLSF